MTDGFEVVLSRRARRDLEKSLPEGVAAAALEFIGGPLRQNPHRVGKPLRGELSHLHSARRGEYRVVYEIIDQRLVIVVITIAHRRDVYRP